MELKMLKDTVLKKRRIRIKIFIRKYLRTESNIEL